MINTNTMSPLIAILLCTKCSNAWRPCDLDLVPISSMSGRPVSGAVGAATSSSEGCSVMRGSPSRRGGERSCQPDPRVEDGVQQVCDQVEQDDEDRRHHHPANHLVDVL